MAIDHELQLSETQKALHALESERDEWAKQNNEWAELKADVSILKSKNDALERALKETAKDLESKKEDASKLQARLRVEENCTSQQKAQLNSLHRDKRELERQVKAFIPRQDIPAHLQLPKTVDLSVQTELSLLKTEGEYPPPPHQPAQQQQQQQPPQYQPPPPIQQQQQQYKHQQAIPAAEVAVAAPAPIVQPLAISSAPPPPSIHSPPPPTKPPQSTSPKHHRYHQANASANSSTQIMKNTNNNNPHIEEDYPPSSVPIGNVSPSTVDVTPTKSPRPLVVEVDPEPTQTHHHQQPSSTNTSVTSLTPQQSPTRALASSVSSQPPPAYGQTALSPTSSAQVSKEPSFVEASFDLKRMQFEHMSWHDKHIKDLEQQLIGLTPAFEAT
eukprot:NODE_176_length_1274_cov_266.244115_g172_i0.p1 GENE.NODE_176_length_1274_cov_266.244115_g172_i0~~NODE_176_length_1274_cov_266.244115_g172_i0.p1  ORF type:complete len:401 (+),score=156.25 NODE_176_length_1274_cov_266.244115_g172_i0:45-1205(+)